MKLALKLPGQLLRKMLSISRPAAAFASQDLPAGKDRAGHARGDLPQQR